MTDDHVDIHKLAAEIEAEVRARRAAGEYPPGFERELDRLFDRFAPAEVSNDFDAALERSEDLVIVDPVIPVASNSPVLGIVKRVMSKLLGWYHVWLAQQISALATASNTALRLLGKRVVELEHVTGDVARSRTIGARIAARRDDTAWIAPVTDALHGCAGRIALVECGDGELLDALVHAGLDAYGVEPRAAVADTALRPRPRGPHRRRHRAPPRGRRGRAGRAGATGRRRARPARRAPPARRRGRGEARPRWSPRRVQPPT